MRTLFHTLGVVLLFGALAHGEQATVRIAFDQGRVTLAAHDVLVSDVLAEWARVGGTIITGADRLPPARITLTLVAADEWSAIEAVIGSANGMLIAGRLNAPAGSSRLARVTITPPPEVAIGPGPARVIDETMPESRFDYGTPGMGVPAYEPDSIEALAQARGTRSPAPSAAPLPMPEVRFQYVDPQSAMPELAEATPEGEAQAKPEDKPKPKPEDNPKKKPGSDR